MTQLSLAIAITAQTFKDKVDKSGKPYILHCLRVMNNLHSEDQELCSIAVMHDLIEDAPYLWTYDSLRTRGFTERVIQALYLLTHKKEVPYMTYIKAIATNPDAVKVKLADLRDNSDITRLKGLTKKDFDRLEKYHIAYVYLSKI